jgi:hypothetical protein
MIQNIPLIVSKNPGILIKAKVEIPRAGRDTITQEEKGRIREKIKEAVTPQEPVVLVPNEIHIPTTTSKTTLTAPFKAAQAIKSRVVSTERVQTTTENHSEEAILINPAQNKSHNNILVI